MTLFRLAGHCRLEHRPHAAVVPERRVRDPAYRASAHHVGRPVEHGSLSVVGARLGLLEPQPGRTRRSAHAIIAATTNTTSVVTPATCLALMLNLLCWPPHSLSLGDSRRARAAALPTPRFGKNHGRTGSNSRLNVHRPHPRVSSFIRFSLLCSVFRLMPRISAARVLLSRVCSSVSRSAGARPRRPSCRARA